ncbi:MAG: FkbM family methyltransferase [Spirochaetota bacterium]
MIWLPVHSIAVLVLAAGQLAADQSAGGGPGSVGVWGALLVAEATIAFVWLFAEAGRPAKRPANVVTSVRLLVALALLAGLAFPVLPPGVLLLLVVLAIVGEATDFLDGLLARRLGPTAFGAKLDMETDALFILALSLFAVHWFALPAWIAAAGLLRYLVAIPFLLMPEPRFPRPFAIFAKSACAVSAVLLVAAILPADVMPAALRLGAASVATALLFVSFGWEAVLRVRALLTEAGDSALRRGLLRSVLTYYGVPFRQFSIRSLYGGFVEPGDLVFDIGAHVGNRIVPLRGLGARVVAVEPQPHCFQLLERHFGDDGQVVLVQGACAGEQTESELRISSANPTLSTLSKLWVDSIKEHFADERIEWDHSITVKTTTLEALIAEHGEPRFVKIDVEGFEHEVLSGLRTPVEVISFEFLPASIEPALKSVELVAALADYEFNYSMVETMRYAVAWTDAGEIIDTLRAMPTTGRSGDVYARRRRR